MESRGSQLTNISGALECFSSARHDLGLYNNVAISSAYMFSSQRPIDVKEAIFSALSVVIQRHPILTAIPVDEATASPYFARIPEINLENAVTFIARKVPNSIGERDLELDELLQGQHNISFKANFGSLPFWRLIILTNPRLSTEFVASFVFHHALGDGRSGVILHEHLLAALCDSPPLLPNKIIASPDQALYPNLELLHPLPIPTESPAAYVPECLWPRDVICLPAAPSRFRSITIPTATTARFLLACRRNGTTITATLPVIITTVLLEVIPTQFTDIECGIPVNIRHWLPSIISADSMGNFIDGFSQYYRRENLQSFSWEEARRSRQTIVDYLNSEGERINIAKLKTVPDMRQFMLAKVGKQRGSTFDVSNVGKLKPAPEGGNWRMGKMVFSRSAWIGGGAFSTGVVSGADASLVIGFCWQQGIISREVMEGIAEKVKNQIEALSLEK